MHGSDIPWLTGRVSAAATDIELAIDCGILHAVLLEITGVLRRDVPSAG